MCCQTTSLPYCPKLKARSHCTRDHKQTVASRHKFEATWQLLATHTAIKRQWNKPASLSNKIVTHFECHCFVQSYRRSKVNTLDHVYWGQLIPGLLHSYENDYVNSCYTVTLSRCHTVTLSHCHTVTLSLCHTVTLSHCSCHTAAVTLQLSHCSCHTVA